MLQTQQEFRHDAASPLGKTAPGKMQGLIEATLAQANWVQGHRDYVVRLDKFCVDSSLPAERGQAGQKGQIALKLEGQDTAAKRVLVAEQRPGQVEGRWAGKADATEMVDARLKRYAAAGAQRCSDPG